MTDDDATMRLDFSLCTTEEILKRSVVEITKLGASSAASL